MSIAAFIVIYGLTGQPMTAAESPIQFDSVESCQVWQKEHSQIVIDEATARGIPFGKVDTKCEEDTGQTAADAFGLPPLQMESASPDLLPPAPQ